jgi:UDP-N-acetylmuramoyl-L-alanyl-D-glutamate--2,6-diaminopimelate ligase
VPGCVTVMATTVGQLADTLPPSMLVEVIGSTDIAVRDLSHDSRQVRQGWAFACVPGDRFDGHEFAPAALEQGAEVLIVDRRLPVDAVQIVVTDVRRAMGPLAAAVHHHPATRMLMVGVTGTNGKTTTTHLLGSVLRGAGYDVRQLGTLTGARTTPEAPDLQRLLSEFVADRVEAVVMEVSSHALALHRVAGTHFDAAVFTNLGRDHLDLHESMEAYFRAKASLFVPELTDVGITNLDDRHGRLLLDAGTVDMVGFGLADASDVEIGIEHHAFTWHGHRVVVPIGGRFNVLNTLAALTTAEVLEIDTDLAIAGLAACPPVPGRFELVSDSGQHAFAVVVDYAHTPDGLEELLASARHLAGGARVIAVFGCGGDRDVEKRPEMGAVAAANADLVIITSDNPRHEDPEAIVSAAAAGVDARYRGSVQLEVDRRAAITGAIGSAEAGDVVVIAGKGHETTQMIGDEVHPFDDRQVAREVLAELATRRRGANRQTSEGRA